jgi:hypothetical protein
MNHLQFFDAVRDPADNPQADEPRPVDWLARVGLAARGAIYLLLAVLTIGLAQGHHQETDQQGAMRQLIQHAWGAWLVGALALGFACYAVWRFSEAIFGVTGEGDGAGPRLQSAGRGVVYLALAFTGVSMLLGSRQDSQQTWTAKIMAHTWGRWLIGVIGVAIIVGGLVLVWQGVRRWFLRYFDEHTMSDGEVQAVTITGTIGNTARGLVFTLIGVCVVVAAWTYDPEKADGLDGALKSLREQPYGGALLWLTAAGLAAFGVYGLLEARYRNV